MAADGRGLVAHAGAVLLRKRADQVRLTRSLSGALTRRERSAGRARPAGLQAFYLCLPGGLAMDLTASADSLPGGDGIAIHTSQSLYCELISEGADRLAWHRSHSRPLEDGLAEALALASGGEPGGPAESGSPVDVV